MTTLDIRSKQEESTTEIVFADKKSAWMTMTRITPFCEGISFHSPADLCSAYCLHNIIDVDNLIKALEEAKRLGWVK